MPWILLTKRQREMKKCYQCRGFLLLFGDKLHKEEENWMKRTMKMYLRWIKKRNQNNEKSCKRLVGYSQYVQHLLTDALNSKVSIRKKGKSTTTKRNRWTEELLEPLSRKMRPRRRNTFGILQWHSDLQGNRTKSGCLLGRRHSILTKFAAHSWCRTALCVPSYF